MNDKAMHYIEKWRPYIRRLARQFANVVSASDDLEQCGILGILYALKHYNPDRSSIDTFIYQCIKTAIQVAALEGQYTLSCPPGTLLSNKNIKHEQHTALSGTLRIDQTDDIAWAYEPGFEQEVMLRDLIAKYDENNVAHLYFISGLNCKEIAEKLSVSPSYVWKVMDRVREALKQEFNQ